MERHSNIVTDQYGDPIEGATVYVYEAGGALADIYKDDASAFSNPLPPTDEDGAFYFNAAQGVYSLIVHAGGVIRDPVVIDLPTAEFIQDGTGAQPRTWQDRGLDYVSALDFMTTAQRADVRARTHLVDVTAALQAAFDFAKDNGKKEVRLPAGYYSVSETLTTGEFVLRGDGERASLLIPTISDGSPVLEVASGTTFFGFENFGIDSGLDQAPWLTGAIDGQNCVGLSIPSDGSSFSAHYHITNVLIRGLKTGADICAYIGTAEKLTLYNCETGLIGEQLNSCRFGVKFENCRKDKVIIDSNGLIFTSYMTEGGILQSGTASSTVDNCTAIVYANPYFERVQNVPFIIFGGTSYCKGLDIQQARVARGSAEGEGEIDLDTYSLKFDRVNGLKISGFYADYLSFYQTTANTKNIFDFTTPNGDFWTHDASKNLSPARNVFPNPEFDHWLAGWPTLNKTMGTIAREQTLVRRGGNAIKLTMTAAAATQTQLVFEPWDSATITLLRGKRYTVYAWVWVPNSAEFDPNDDPVKTYVSLTATPNGTGGAIAESNSHSYKRDAWNLYAVSVTIPADATTFNVAFRMDKSAGGGTAVGTEYIVVDSIYIIEGDGQEHKIVNGQVTDGDLNPCRVVGGVLRLISDTAHADTDLNYNVGDHIIARTVAAGGSPGSVCTTAGAGGTAVFKAMASVAA